MKNRKLILSIILIICAIVGIIVGLDTFAKSFSYENDKNFESNKWQNDIEERIYMLADLENKYLKNGMSKNEILRILGEPDGRFPDGKNYTWKKKFAYDLGIDFLDPCEYVIYFDDNDGVISWNKYCS